MSHRCKAAPQPSTSQGMICAKLLAAGGTWANSSIPHEKGVEFHILGKHGYEVLGPRRTVPKMKEINIGAHRDPYLLATTIGTRLIANVGEIPIWSLVPPHPARCSKPPIRQPLQETARTSLRSQNLRPRLLLRLLPGPGAQRDL